MCPLNVPGLYCSGARQPGMEKNHEMMKMHFEKEKRQNAEAIVEMWRIMLKHSFVNEVETNSQPLKTVNK